MPDRGDPTRWVLPGGVLRREEGDPYARLENVDLGPVRRLLGNGLQDIPGRDGILTRFSVGLLDAGAVRSPLYGDGISTTPGAAGASFHAGIVVPDGRTWRIRAAQVQVRDAAGGLVAAPYLGVSLVPGQTDGHQGTVTGAGASRPGIAYPYDVPMVHAAINTGIVSGNLDQVLFPGDAVEGVGEVVNATDVVHFAFVYQSFPCGARPPF